jgi:hypothetical protein
MRSLIIRFSILFGLFFPALASAVTVVEFYNTNLDNYFITADANEAAAIDGGSAGPGWSRTSYTFTSGGSTPVCRFYGSQSPGPNSHFYTVDSAECQGLKDQQIPAGDPRKLTDKSWNFESLDFVSTPATNQTCPTGTTPVYRAYNNGFARGIDSNHRITSSTVAIQEVVNRGWSNEGVVMCEGAVGVLFSSISLDAQNAGRVAIGDFDGDGLVDIVAMSNGGSELVGPQSYVYRQNANGSFLRSPFDPGFFGAVSAGDLNRDGISDLILGASCELLVKLGSSNLQFTNSGSFSNGSCATTELWLGDFNGDSILDVVSLSRYPSIAIGDGTGSFTPRTPVMPFQYQGKTVAIGDVDGNGTPDMIAINPQYESRKFLLSIALNDGSGNYTNVKNFIHTQASTWSSEPRAKLVDVNKDGRKDILYFPGGTGFLQLLATAPSAYDAAPTWIEMNSSNILAEVTDLNGDGNVDVVASTSDGLMFMLGNGKGGWATPIFPLGKKATYSGGVAVRDINGDNRQDIVFGAGSTVFLLLQQP